MADYISHDHEHDGIDRRAASPGPLKVPAEKLRSLLGLTSVQYKQGETSLAVVDSNLS